MTDTPKSSELPRWAVQILAWVTGIGGLALDYGLNILGPDNHIPLVWYALCIGVAFGMHPNSLIRIIVESIQKK